MLENRCLTGEGKDNHSGARTLLRKELASAAHLRDSCRDRGICRDKENPNVLTFTIDRNNHIAVLTSSGQLNPVS